MPEISAYSGAFIKCEVRNCESAKSSHVLSAKQNANWTSHFIRNNV